MDFKSFLSEYETKVIPISRDSNLAIFNACVTGKDSDYKKSAEARIALDRIHSDKTAFAKVKAWRESGEITDPELKRQLDIIYLAYIEKQIDQNTIEELITRQGALEQKYNTYRATVDGKDLSDNQIDSVLSTSTDSLELEKTWKASKQIGNEVAADIVHLAKLRNKAARSVGFDNFHDMQMRLGEQDPAKIARLFDQLDNLTRGAFEKSKEDIESALSSKFNMKQSQLKPWHYQDRHFKEAPEIYEVSLDHFYREKDPVEIARKYFEGVGLPVDRVLKRSDLYERTGKTQSAECMNIDRAGDVRIICNMQSDHFWSEILMHELGHAVYDYYNDQQKPWLLRNVAHPCTTEAVAAFFGRLAGNSEWLVQVAGVPKDEAVAVENDCALMNRLVQLIFSRFVQVMVRFERGLYENPDQDLNKLWWDLVENYQGLSCPDNRDEPDWATKIHLITDPVYYHNYLIAELMASQFDATIRGKVLGLPDSHSSSFAGDNRIGNFFKENVFKLGALYPWNEMIERATGEKLSSAHYARQFVDTR